MIEHSHHSRGATELRLNIRLPDYWPLPVGALAIILLVVIGLQFSRSNPDPFTPNLLAAIKFTLYYPTALPEGYRIDDHSVTTPSAGIVVFDLVGPSHNRIWVSEEARPTSFNLGGFYDNLEHVHEFRVSDGSIAFGYKGSIEIASRANNTTWLLCNTNDEIPESQMVNMLKSILPAH